MGPFRAKPHKQGSTDGEVVRAVPCHECGTGLNPCIDAICGLNLLLALSFASRGFSPGTPVFPSLHKPTLPNSNSTRNGRRRTIRECATS